MKVEIKTVFLFIVATIAVTVMFLYFFYMFLVTANKIIGIPLSLLPNKGNLLEVMSFVEFILKYKMMVAVTVCLATFLTVNSGFFELE
ncbi:hypothetical protein [Carnobacterium maltaromaticum]|uniref:hypothetical protein n=1 Tax=Carnobacterium maltaromaticum TaxID=2751 RepID=UPI0012F7F744|nr:hypothetical protein [Carnobacterium maltaromaticum]